jgi:hypothetical protein
MRIKLVDDDDSDERKISFWDSYKGRLKKGEMSSVHVKP